MQETPFLAPFWVELRKLKRSLAMVLAIAAPALIGVFAFANALRATHPVSWSEWTEGSAAIWAFFMLPMSVTALAALVAHMEHASGAWSHLRAMAQPRWRIYAAKALCLLLLVLIMSLLLAAFVWAAPLAAGAFKPATPYSGRFEFWAFLGQLVEIGLSALLLIAIQLWMSVRFLSFVPGLALGVGGVFFNVAAPSAKAGVFSPWQMPLNTLSPETWRAETALALGAGLGAAALVAVIRHLARREAP